MTYFVHLKSWFLFLLCSLFSSKNPYNFLCGGGGGGGRGVLYIRRPEGEGFDRIRQGGGGKGEGLFKKTQF